MRELDTAELAALLADDRDVQLVFSLPPSSFGAGHIPGSRVFGDPASAVGELDASRPVVVYCTDVACQASRVAGRLLESRGFDDVRHYAGGLAAWVGAGHPLESDPPDSDPLRGPGRSRDRLPVVLVADSDPARRQELSDALRSRLFGEYDVRVAGDACAARDRLAEAGERREPLALAVVEKALERADGGTLLSDLAERYPAAGRVLLVAQYVSDPAAYDDLPQAIEQLGQGTATALVTQPWTNLETEVLAELDGQLADHSVSAPRPDRIMVVGRQWSARAHELRDALERNRLPYRWLDVDVSAQARALLAEVGLAHATLPVVVLPNGRALADPSNRQVADALGVHSRPLHRHYDVVIVGAGPAGLAAAVYGASEGLSTLVVEAEAGGGQAGTSSRIENYLGFPAGISGSLLAQRALQQAGRLGGEMVIPVTAAGISPHEHAHELRFDDGTGVAASTVVVASGASYALLDALGIDRLLGAGVYYGSSLAEMAGCTGQRVGVVGAGNSAGQAALHLAGVGAEVTMLVRGEGLAARMSAYLVERILGHERIDVRLGTTVSEVRGLDRLELAVLSTDGGVETLGLDAMFVLIGARPHTGWLTGTVATSEQGFVLTGTDARSPSWTRDRDPLLFETSVPGVFAVGDARAGSVKRVASAVGEGSAVISSVHEYLKRTPG